MEDVVGLGSGEPERPGDRGQDLRGWVRGPALLESDDVFGRHASQRGEFLPAQARGSAPRRAGQANGFGAGALAPDPQIASSRPLIHCSSVTPVALFILVPGLPGSAHGTAAGLLAWQSLSSPGPTKGSDTKPPGSWSRPATPCTSGHAPPGAGRRLPASYMPVLSVST